MLIPHGKMMENPNSEQTIFPGLCVHVGNRLDRLAKQLANLLQTPISSPVAPEIIVAQSRGMERWVSMSLAREHGIAANLSFQFPKTFVNEIFKKAVPDAPETSVFDRDIMTFQLMGLIPEHVDQPGFETLKRYLADDPNGLKLFQLCQRVAGVFDQYPVFRPEMIFKWEEGKGESQSPWQARLWRALVSRNGNRHPARLKKSLFQRIGEGKIRAGDLGQRISVFGISYLPPFFIDVFGLLSRVMQVNLFFTNPCQEYWADIVSLREEQRIKGKYKESDSWEMLHLDHGNRLLGELGGQGRDFLKIVSELECQFYETFDEPDAKTMLAWIQSDILHLRQTPRTMDIADRSIQIHSCHSPMREMETLYDHLLDMFQNDPDLSPKDIMVMTPDIAEYAPFVHAVFGDLRQDGPHIPYGVADQGFDRESGVVKGFLAILDLRATRFEASALLAVFEYPGVKERFGLEKSDIDPAVQWIEQTRIRWGIDEKDRVDMGLPGFSENTWKAGIQRLLLGYAMPADEAFMFSGILPYDDMEGEAAIRMGRFLECLESLFALAECFDDLKTLGEWASVFNQILDQFFKADEKTEGEFQFLRKQFGELKAIEKKSGFDGKINLDAALSFISNRLKNETVGRGFISGGVTFCSMLPMRSIPADVICLVGMNGGAFPGKSPSLSFDLISKHRAPGDRSKSDDDKYLFLEAILSARKRLYISYTGQSMHDNSGIPPSAVVLSLMDVIKETFDAPDKKEEGREDGRGGEEGRGEEEDGGGGEVLDHVMTRHRLQAFSRDYFIGPFGFTGPFGGDDGGGAKADGPIHSPAKRPDKWFSFSTLNFNAAQAFASPEKKPVPFISTGLSPPSDEWKQVDIEDIARFFSHPSRFLLEKRLGLFLRDDAPGIEATEHFSLDPLMAYQLGDDLAGKGFKGEETGDFFSLEQARGRLPHGTPGRVYYQRTKVGANAFARKVGQYSGLKPGESLAALKTGRVIEGSIELSGELAGELAGATIAGAIHCIGPRGAIFARFARQKAKDMLNAWIRHLFICALQNETGPGKTETGQSGTGQTGTGYGEAENRPEKIKKSILICADSAWEFDDVMDAEGALESLLDLFWQGLRHPLPFFPESSYAFATRMAGKKSVREGLKAAMSKWEGGDFAMGESQDLYYARCFGLGHPLDDAFMDISTRVFQPMLAHCRPIVEV